jgi:hypothetical protein
MIAPGDGTSAVARLEKILRAVRTVVADSATCTNGSGVDGHQRVRGSTRL